MLFLQQLLHTLLVVLDERGPADLVHEEQHGAVPVPLGLLGQDAHPELQHRRHAHATGLGTLHDMSLKGTERRTCLYGSLRSLCHKSRTLETFNE